ncbi:MAG: hypothetical protein J6D03_06540 [Clostridia bacterium]|nr:hypothetical protein [Clostridia bacterium]
MDSPEVAIAHLEERAKSNTKRLDEHDARLDSLEKTYSIMEKMDYRMGNVENTVTAIKNDIQKGKEQKGMKWDKLIDYLFYAILAYALFKLGLK